MTSKLEDRSALQEMLREATRRAGYTGDTSLPTAVAIELAKLIKEVVDAERIGQFAAEPLLKNKLPEAAARQTAMVLAWSAESALVNLEALEQKTRTSKTDMRRMRETCDTLVAQCKDLGVDPVGLRGKRCDRLAKRMSIEKPIQESGGTYVAAEKATL